MLIMQNISVQGINHITVNTAIRLERLMDKVVLMVKTQTTDMAHKSNRTIRSATLPKRKEEYRSKELFPFFYGLLAEGKQKERQCRELCIDENDHFTRLLETSCI